MNGDAQLLVGQVMHRRLRPVANRFVYPVFAVRVKLSALGRLTGAWRRLPPPVVLARA